jgi:hypothetical protein
MKFKANIDGKLTELPAKRFSHYINNIQFWFALHDSPDRVASLTVSHWASGKRVALIGPSERCGQKNNKELAVAALDRLVENQGAERVCQILTAAEQPT